MLQILHYLRYALLYDAIKVSFKMFIGTTVSKPLPIFSLYSMLPVKSTNRAFFSSFRWSANLNRSFPYLKIFINSTKNSKDSDVDKPPSIHKHVTFTISPEFMQNKRI